MARMQLGIRHIELEKILNKGLTAAGRRIKRCISVKSIAIQKIRSYEPDQRAYGFKHFERILYIQIKSYNGYVGEISNIKAEIQNIKNKIGSLKLEGNGIFSKHRFKRSKIKLIKCMADIEEFADIIKKKLMEIIAHIDLQAHSLKTLKEGPMHAVEEADLVRNIAQEINKSEELLGALGICKDAIFRLIQEVVPLQYKIVRSLKKSVIKSMALAHKAEEFGEKLQKSLWFFYGIKTYLLLASVLTGAMFSSEIVKAYSDQLFYGVVSVDSFTDWLLGLPLTVYGASVIKDSAAKAPEYIRRIIKLCRLKGEKNFNHYVERLARDAVAMPLSHLDI